jgi:aminotransferase
VLADVASLGAPSSAAAAMTLLERTGVASVPGSAFHHGDGGDGLVRFCFAKEDDVLDEACRRLAALSVSR